MKIERDKWYLRQDGYRQRIVPFTKAELAFIAQEQNQ